MKLKPYDAPRQKRTRAQDAATMRNLGIYQLRGLHAQSHILRGWRRKLVQWVIDRELANRGAMTMSQQQAALREKLAREEKEWEITF